MKNLFSIVFLLLVSASLFAGQGIIVSQKYNSPENKGTVTLTWYVSETQCKVKMDMQSSEVNATSWFIPDLANSKLLSYGEGPLPAKVPKTYYSIPVQNIKGTNNASRVSVNRTRETKTISHMTCEKIVVKTNRSTTEMWVTTDFKTDFYKYYGFFQSSYELMGLNEESIQGFPLESVTKDNTGKVISSLELSSVTQSNLSPADFTVPADYTLSDVKR